MSIVEFDVLPSWSPDASERTGENTKCPWVGVVEGTEGGKLLTPSPLPTGILYSRQFRSHQGTKKAVPSNSTINIYDIMEK